ncbi:MspA family porin [Nocardia sp. NPDC052566]|uniref:MspA family porin n=1 Tax=Nocardia sp. NPDC052566 TaxID=3364330 RepID=UPI0037C51969
MINRKIVARMAGVGAAATVAVGLLSTGAANADTFIPLPGGEITETLDDGTIVHVKMENESANINPSMNGTPLSRNVWASGRAVVDLEGKAAKGGQIFPGYVVGCQVNIVGGNVSGAGGGKTDWEGKKPDFSAKAGGALTLGPGQAKVLQLLDVEEADDFGNEAHKKRTKFKGTHGAVTYNDATIAVNGCAGYAQARSFVRVKVETDNVVSIVTLWGQPFSLG